MLSKYLTLSTDPILAIVATVPSCSNAVTDFPRRDALADSSDATDDLVPWDQGANG